MRRAISALLVLALMASLLLCMTATVSADSLYIRKIVSVVYDDSGSMKNGGGDKWAYANYAMQSFCGMLNSDDQLYITYMSKAEADEKQGVLHDPAQVDLSSGGIQSSVNAIRNHSQYKNTHFISVEAAFNKLKNVSDPNPNTQYWLVVITDGDFNDFSYESPAEQKDILNEKFGEYASQTMPNGTKPQITFLGIGNVAAPDEDQSKGIYTYSASDASGIIGAMSDMADRISGRTRLKKDAIRKVNDNTIQVSSTIPLLNIAVFAQGSKAKVTSAVHNNEKNIPISRQASLEYPNYNDLVGGAFLLGDSQNPIGSGTYEITFDQAVDLDDVIILFEPALEMRMSITVNGQPISDKSELSNAMEGDKVSVSCKIYEMGTDTEIDPALMPPGTKFEIAVSENGTVVDRATGKEMLLQDYEVKSVETEIVASVVIEGFNPIDYSAKFTPVQYVPTYTITPSFGSGVKSVKLDQIAANKDLTVCFTVYADGEAITDPEAVKALNPVISVSPQGNDGTTTYANDGRIVFTPTSASASSGTDSLNVEVKCTIDGGVTASETYTVLIAEYQVLSADADRPVKKTELFGNKEAVSFYITKDGVKMEKEAVEKQISVLLNEEHADLKNHVVVAPDGTITVTPYSEEEHKLTFWNWWTNWYYYFGLEGEDITVTLSHAYGSADATVDIVEEDIGYQLLNVYLPLLLEIAILAYLIWWIYAICAKPKFLPGAVIYMADLNFYGSRGNRYHEIDPITEVYLNRYNKLKYRWKPTLKSTKHSIGKGLTISAGYGGSIICHSEIWYKGDITPKNRVQEELDHPQRVKAYIQDHDSLRIELISPYDADAVHLEESIDHPNPDLYYLHTKMANVSVIDGLQTIESGTIFAYAIRMEH
ncbi:MAG: hypothetical protein IJN60_07230 [Oscillospiraceae bacterium]|nr:hypothetical protein [Oscillospiraceae bacterium]